MSFVNLMHLMLLIMAFFCLDLLCAKPIKSPLISSSAGPSPLTKPINSSSRNLNSTSTSTSNTNSNSYFWEPALGLALGLGRTAVLDNSDELTESSKWGFLNSFALSLSFQGFPSVETQLYWAHRNIPWPSEPSFSPWIFESLGLSLLAWKKSWSLYGISPGLVLQTEYLNEAVVGPSENLLIVTQAFHRYSASLGPSLQASVGPLQLRILSLLRSSALLRESSTMGLDVYVEIHVPLGRNR